MSDETSKQNPRDLAADPMDAIYLVNEKTGQRFRVIPDQALAWGANGHFQGAYDRPIEIQPYDR